MLEKKEIRRWKIENIDEARLLKIVEEVREDLENLHQQHQYHVNERTKEPEPKTLEEAINALIMESTKNGANPPMMYKKIKGRRIEFCKE